MKRLAIPLMLLVALALVIGTVGCGGNDEEEIGELIDEQIAALNELDLQTVYDQKTPGYRSRLAFDDYQAFMMVAWADYVPLAGTVELELTDRSIRVDDDWAYMTGKLVVAGQVLLEYTDASPDVWHKIDGDWYDTEENPLDPGYDPSELPD